MKKTILSSKTTKYLLIVLLIVFVFGILYYFMSNLNNKTGTTLVDAEMPLTHKYPVSPDNIIEGFNSSNMGYNQTKMIVIYTASWCPHCRSFMGMQDKESPISEDSEFSKTKRAYYQDEYS